MGDSSLESQVELTEKFPDPTKTWVESFEDKEKAPAPSLPPSPANVRALPKCDRSTTPKNTVSSKVWSKTSSTTLAEVLLWPESSSTTPTNTESEPKPSSALKVFAPVNLSTAVKRLNYLSVTACLLVLCLKVLSLALWRKNAVTEVKLPKLLVLTLLSSPTTQTPAKLESNSPLAPKNFTNPPTEPWSVSS